MTGGLHSPDHPPARDEEGSYLRDLLDRTMKTFGTLHAVDLFPWLAPVDPQQGLQRATRLGAELRAYFHGLIERGREGVRVGEGENGSWHAAGAQERKVGKEREGGERAQLAWQSSKGSVRECDDERDNVRERMHEGRGETLVDLLLRNERSGDSDVQLDADEQAMLLFDMVLGGSYTTSASTEWALAELAMQPDVLARLRDEVDGWYEERQKAQERGGGSGAGQASPCGVGAWGGGGGREKQENRRGAEQRPAGLQSDGLTELPYLKASQAA